MKYEVIGRFYKCGEALREANELLDVVTGVGVFCDNSGIFMTGECAHHIMKIEWHRKNGKLIETELR